MINASDIAVRVLADENERLADALSNAHSEVLELVTQNNIQSALLDRLARREIDLALAEGELVVAVRVGVLRSIKQKLREFPTTLVHEANWFK